MESVFIQNSKPWHPISTAPKDGTLLVLRDEMFSFVCAMAYNKEIGHWAGSLHGRNIYWDEEACPIYGWQLPDS